jgi:nucleoid DNA-binding protein
MLGKKQFITVQKNQKYVNGKSEKSPLTLSRIIKTIAFKNGIEEQKVRKVLRDFFTLVTKEVQKNRRVSFYGLGKFRIKRNKSKRVKIPKTQKYVRTKDKSYLVFKSSFEI